MTRAQAMHDRTTTETDHDRPGPDSDDRCPSRFDRWRCALRRGHAGLHAAEEQQGRTTWNDTAEGRRLVDL